MTVVSGHLADRHAIGGPTAGRDRDTDVAIRDHTSNAAVIADDRQRPAVTLPHVSDGFGQIRFRPRGLHVAGHQISNLS